jgi:hypothetical protein
MARDILSEYGNDSGAGEVPRATNGGQQTPKDIPYCPPQGPKGINDPKTPGLHGNNHGNSGTQGRH